MEIACTSGIGNNTLILAGSHVTNVTSVAMGSFLFQADQPFDSVGRDVAGKAWAVIPTGSLNISVTPPPGTDGAGLAIQRAMLNPVATGSSSDPQGLDERGSGNFDGNLSAGQPISVSAGDVILVTKANLSYVEGDRSGMFDEIGALHILAEAPPANALLDATVGWGGRGTPGYSIFDVDAWYANRPVVSSPPGMPAYSRLMESFDQFHPLLPLSHTALANAGGYQEFSPTNFGDGTGGSNNYGQQTAAMMEHVAIALATDAYGELETKAIATRTAQLGAEIYQSAQGTGDVYGADGGHWAWLFFPVAFHLHVTGQSSELDTAFGIAGGNFSQAFEITQTIYDQDLVPHQSDSKPSIWRERTLGAQPGGTVLRIPSDSSLGDDSQVDIPAGAIATRLSDGATAVVATHAGLATSGTLDVAIDAQPTPAFTSGDVVYFDVPEAWKAVGSFDWLKGEYATGTFPQPENWSPAATNNYRNQQAWAAQIAALDLMGAWPDAGRAAKGYLVRAMASNEPAAFNDLPIMSQGWTDSSGASYSAGQAFYGAAYAGSSQVKPSHFLYQDWSVTAAGDGEVTLTISALPPVGGGLSAIEYSVDGGSWTSTGLATTGTANVSVAPGDRTIRIRAVNAVGSGIPSSVKSVVVSGIDARVLATAVQRDSVGSSANRLLRGYYMFNDTASVHDGSNADPGGTSPTSGDEFVVLVAHIGGNAPINGAPLDGTPASVEELDGTDIETDTNIAATEAVAGTTLARQTYICDFVQPAGTAAESFALFGSSGSTSAINMRMISSVKVPATHTTVGGIGANSIAANPSVTLDLSGVAGDWIIVAIAQKDDGGTAISWSGASESDSHSGSFNGTDRYQSVAVGTGTGSSVSVTATGATQLSVLALPPV